MAGPSVTTHAGLERRFTVRGRWEFEARRVRLDFSAAFCRFVPKILTCFADIFRRLGRFFARGLRLTRRGLLADVASRLT